MCFFFQAEDGIRDYKVTGVQTCALPISRACSSPSRARSRSRASGFRAGDGRSSRGGWPSSRRACRGSSRRSEERRVGKSVDLGGRRIIKKKKKNKTTIAGREQRDNRCRM